MILVLAEAERNIRSAVANNSKNPTVRWVFRLLVNYVYQQPEAVKLLLRFHYIEDISHKNIIVV